jgi:hypothetical protein
MPFRHIQLQSFVWLILVVVVGSRGSSVSIVTRLRAGRPRFDSRQGQGMFLFATGSSPGLRRPGCEADHSPQSSAEVKNVWSCTSTTPYVFMAWCLVKHRDNFNFIGYVCGNTTLLFRGNKMNEALGAHNANDNTRNN